jgi:aryl-alcohol dehydrogenase-like predicted oxidoreductase
MEKLTLGKTPLTIAPLVFGGNIFGWTADQATSFRLLDAFTDEGFNCVDTADAYSYWVPGNNGGVSEQVIGNWIAQGGGRREKIILATKVGVLPGRLGLGRANIGAGVEDALRRLKTDDIDLFQSHRDDPNTPIEEVLETYRTLIAAGKVRFIGASNYEPDRFKEALDIANRKKLPRYETMQPLYNLYSRFPYEQGLAEVCQQHGVTVLPYFSLASGFLTGKYRSTKDTEGKARGSSIFGYFTVRGMSILRALDQVADAHSAKPAQVALAWLMAHPNVAPVASATTIQQLRELTMSTRLKLSDADMTVLNNASDPLKNVA